MSAVVYDAAVLKLPIATNGAHGRNTKPVAVLVTTAIRHKATILTSDRTIWEGLLELPGREVAVAAI